MAFIIEAFTHLAVNYIEAISAKSDSKMGILMINRILFKLNESISSYNLVGIETLLLNKNTFTELTSNRNSNQNKCSFSLSKVAENNSFVNSFTPPTCE